MAHDFNENVDVLKQLLKYENIFFSIGKNALYDRNNRIEQIPNDKLLVETDGKKEVVLKDVLLKIAQIKNDENILNIIYENTLKVLNHGQIA